MIERNRNKYLLWATIALACLVVDGIFAFALGGIVKWLAGVASPLVWAGLVAVALVAARVVPVIRGIVPMREAGVGPQA